MRTLVLERLEERVVPAFLQPNFVESLAASGIGNATAFEFAPNGEIWALEQTGRVLRFRNDSATPDVVGDLSTLGLDPVGERGLLGIAFDPHYDENKFVYFYYTSTDGATHNQVSRFAVVDNNPSDYYLVGTSTDSADAGSTGTPTESVIFNVSPLTQTTSHNGGAIHFGAGGYLFIATGDSTVGTNSQSLGNTLGKLLRINADGSIPLDNPFYNDTTGDNRAIWALGLRNPFTFAVQPGTERIFINDVGANSFEEIDDGVAGANYGWPGIEGNVGTPPTSPGTYHAPVYTYAHGIGDFVGIAITGGAFYSADNKPYPAEYANDYFFTDLVTGWINVLDTSTNEVRQFATGILSPVDLKVGNDGSLYYLTRNTGQVYRIEYTTGPTLQALQPSGTDSLAGSVVSSFAAGVPGIAVEGLGAEQTGTWQFSLDSGATWQNFGHASDGSSRLLRATDRVRFLPAANHAGGATISYRSWDLTGGSAGGTADLTGGVGSGTPYGDVRDTARVLEGNVILRGSQVYAVGTVLADTFQVTGGASPQVTFNGTVYTFPTGVQTVTLLGQGGADTAAIYGTAANETATLRPGSGALTGAGYNVTWSSIETAYTYGNGGTDTAFLYDSAGNDSFGATPTYAYLIGAGTSEWAVGFGSVYGYATAGGNDTATLFDSAGNDTFGANPSYAYMLGAGYIEWAVGFDAAYGYASAGYDLAYLYDSAGNDVYGANPSYAYLQGPGFINWAVGFNAVYAYAGSGGTDAAYLYDSAGNDVFGARPEYAYLQGSSFINWAVGFANVYAFATAGGSDGAYLFDSAGNDTFNGSGATGELVLGSGRNYAAQAFDLVSIYSLRGGLDRRNLGIVNYVYEQTGPWL